VIELRGAPEPKMSGVVVLAAIKKSTVGGLIERSSHGQEAASDVTPFDRSTEALHENVQ
jgi:hypothetical protein